VTDATHETRDIAPLAMAITRVIGAYVEEEPGIEVRDVLAALDYVHGCFQRHYSGIPPYRLN
jgi:hypothetical protein